MHLPHPSAGVTTTVVCRWPRRCCDTSEALETSIFTRVKVCNQITGELEAYFPGISRVAAYPGNLYRRRGRRSRRVNELGDTPISHRLVPPTANTPWGSLRFEVFFGRELQIRRASAPRDYPI